MKILSIESSCDETAAAVVENGRKILSSVVASQVEEHKLYGGVVPEIASRRHCEAINAVVRKALTDAQLTLSQIDAIGVTYAPGLIGALLVGVNFAKGLSMATGLPLIPVHHLRSHIAANYLEHPALEPPFLCLVVSGGHSHIVEVTDYTVMKVIGRTRDDAAGEAFVNDAPYDFSFSGLKTAVINLIHNASQKGETLPVADLSAAFRQTVVNSLSGNFLRAAQDSGYTKLVLAGGVSANSLLRRRMTEECQQRGWSCYYPPLSLCGDNGAMVGAQAYYEFLAGHIADTSLNAYPTMDIAKNHA